jgi:hypothetical protein
MPSPKSQRAATVAGHTRGKCRTPTKPRGGSPTSPQTWKPAKLSAATQHKQLNAARTFADCFAKVAPSDTAGAAELAYSALVALGCVLSTGSVIAGARSMLPSLFTACGKFVAASLLTVLMVACVCI